MQFQRVHQFPDLFHVGECFSAFSYARATEPAEVGNACVYSCVRPAGPAKKRIGTLSFSASLGKCSGRGRRP